MLNLKEELKKAFRVPKRCGIKWSIWIIAGLFFANLVLVGYFVVFSVNNNDLKVIFLDVGQGDSILIQTAKRQNILIDGGPDQNIIYKLDKYIPFFQRKIDLMILTHPDPDHLNGLVAVLRRYKVIQAIDNGNGDASPAYAEYINLIQLKNIARFIISQPQKINFERLSLNFFWPAKNLISEPIKDDNFASIIFKIVDDKNSFLFTGDATEETEAMLINSGQNLEADVLKVGHHGSKYSSMIEFLEKIKPKFAIISVGADNKFGHPSLRAIKNLETVGAKILRTDEKGDIIFTSDGQQLKIKTQK